MKRAFIHKLQKLRSKPVVIMKHVFYIVLLFSSLRAVGQILEVPSGVPLTVQGNINLPAGFSLQINNQDYLKYPGTGTYNTYLGVQAGSTGTGNQNTFVGFQTGQVNSSGEYNTFLGYQSGATNTTGGYNVFIGQRAGIQNTAGSSNLFMGSYAGGSNSNGSYNLFLGNSSGQSTVSGNGNTFIGDGAGYGNQSGSNNTYIGRASGYSGNNLGNNNTFIGFQAGVSSANINVENSSAIGVNAFVSQSNSVIIGATGALVGIGNSSPKNKLEITQGNNGNSGLRFTNLTSSNTPTISTNQFLTVNANGDVVLAMVGNSKGSFRQTANIDASKEWLLNDNGYLTNLNSKGVIIGSGVGKAPEGYNLYVSKGVLTEKVKIALKDTDDWSDGVFAHDYKLKSIREVEKFVKNNHHLPGIPSAKEMVEHGNDLHETDNRLLTKIEELTLYMIKQNKEMIKLREENYFIKKELLKIKGVSKKR